MIKGDNAAVTSVRIINPEGEEFSAKEYPVHLILLDEPIECVEYENENGDTVITDVYIPPLNVQAGDILRFNFTVDNADALCAFVRDAIEYKALSDSNRNDEFGSVELVSGLNSFDIHIGESDIAKIHNYGTILSANGMTLESIEVLGQEGTDGIFVLAAFGENDEGDRQVEIKPFKYIDNYTDIARVEATVIGNGGGMIAFNDYENWVNAKGEDEGAFNAGSETWVFDNISCDKEFSIHIQAWWGNVYVESMTFKDSDGNVLFTLTPDTCAYPIAKLSAGDSFDIYTAELLGDSLSELAKVKVETEGEGALMLTWSGTDSFRMEDVPASNDEYIDVSDIDLSYPQMCLIGSEGTVNVLNITFADENGNELFKLDFTTEDLNAEYVEPIYTIETGGHYLLHPEILLGDDFDKLYSVEIETRGDGEGNLGWHEYDPVNGESEDFPYVWRQTDNLKGGETWTASGMNLTKGQYTLFMQCWDSSVDILSVTFKDADGNVLASYNADNMPAVIADLDAEEEKPYYIYAQTLLGRDFDKVAKISVNTFGDGNGGLIWGDGETGCLRGDAGEPWSGDIDADMFGIISLHSWWQNVQLLSVVFYDAEGNVLFTLDDSTAYMNIAETPIGYLTKYNEDYGEKSPNFYADPSSVLGDKYSDLAFVKFNGFGGTDFAYISEDGKHLYTDVSLGTDTLYAIAPNADRPVFIIWAQENPVVLTGIEFYDENKNLIGELNIDNIGDNVLTAGSSLAVLGNPESGQIEQDYVLNLESILGDKVSELASIEANTPSCGGGTIYWSTSENDWQTGDYSDNGVWSGSPVLDSYNLTANVMAYWGLNYIDSVVFKDAQGNVLETLTPENAATLNVPKDATNGFVAYEGSFNLTDSWEANWLKTAPVQSEAGDVLKIYL
ncbi:MAG: hypothetical protein ACI4Q4_03970, partial [Oscillospiraceae bacterium]